MPSSNDNATLHNAPHDKIYFEVALGSTVSRRVSFDVRQPRESHSHTVTAVRLLWVCGVCTVSDVRTRLQFTIAACSRQHGHSQAGLKSDA
jgi:hypothetical protein